MCWGQSRGHRPSRCTPRQWALQERRLVSLLAQKVQCLSSWVKSLSWNCIGCTYRSHCPSSAKDPFYSSSQPPYFRLTNRVTRKAFQKWCTREARLGQVTLRGSRFWSGGISLGERQMAWSLRAWCTVSFFSLLCCTSRTMWTSVSCCWQCSQG